MLAVQSLGIRHGFQEIAKLSYKKNFKTQKFCGISDQTIELGSQFSVEYICIITNQYVGLGGLWGPHNTIEAQTLHKTRNFPSAVKLSWGFRSPQAETTTRVIKWINQDFLVDFVSKKYANTEGPEVSPSVSPWTTFCQHKLSFGLFCDVFQDENSEIKINFVIIFNNKTKMFFAVQIHFRLLSVISRRFAYETMLRERE